MCKIIGGEFAIHPKGFETFDNTSYLQSIDYSSGRCGLYAILKDIESLRKKRGGILLPNYLCASITNTIIDAGCKLKQKVLKEYYVTWILMLFYLSIILEWQVFLKL